MKFIDFIFSKLKFLYKLNLMQKFLLTYCVLILFPLSILFGYTYTKMSQITRENILSSSKQTFNQSTDFLTYKIYRIFDISNSLTIDSSITDILRRNPDEYPLSEQIGDLKYLKNFLSSYENEMDTSKICVYVNDKFISTGDNLNIISMSSLKNTKCIDLINSTNSRFLWGPASYFVENATTFEESDVSLFKTIISPDNFSENIGYLTLTIKRDLIVDIIDKINSVPNSVSYLVNSEGIIICSSTDSDLSKYSIDINTIENYTLMENEFNNFKLNNASYYLQSSAIDKTDWHLVNIIPEASITTMINTQRAYLILIVILLAIVSISLAFYFVDSINKRLSKVISGMRSVHKGDLSNYIEDNSDDELGELIDNYNYMISKMDVLIDEQYKLGKAAKNSELKALQSQINPHFLYNTLDMINWMSYKNMNKEISKAVKSLAKFYKLSLNKGKDFTCIEDELLHSKLYVDIQNMRYNDRISLHISVSEKITKCFIPKITLQPIIENAINHGILGKGNENGSIWISSYMDNEDIVLQISDDGIGINETSLSSLLSNGNIPTRGSGYGLKNINERIQLLYGKNYGISFISAYGHGTTVEVKLPKITEK